MSKAASDSFHRQKERKNSKISVTTYLIDRTKTYYRGIQQQVKALYCLATGCHWCLFFLIQQYTKVHVSSGHQSDRLLWLTDRLSVTGSIIVTEMIRPEKRRVSWVCTFNKCMCETRMQSQRRQMTVSSLNPPQAKGHMEVISHVNLTHPRWGKIRHQLSDADTHDIFRHGVTMCPW